MRAARRSSRRGSGALGRALAAAGDADAAVEPLERALAVFARLGLPLEAARTHLLLAGALPGPRAPPSGRAGRRSTGFEQLGRRRATPTRRRRFLRSLGVKAARRGPRDAGALTKREREVLELLAEGLTNQELAERLFLTRKTVEHHVRSVLRKLGLRNRAEAAAYAVRQPRARFRHDLGVLTDAPERSRRPGCLHGRFEERSDRRF